MTYVRRALSFARPARPARTTCSTLLAAVLLSLAGCKTEEKASGGLAEGSPPASSIAAATSTSKALSAPPSAAGAAAPRGSEKAAALPSAAPSPELPPLANTPPPGPAYFGVRDAGLIKLDEGRFSVAFEKLQGVRRIAPGTGGDLYLASNDGVHRFSSGKLDKLSSDGVAPLVRDLAVGPDGHVWTITVEGVGHYDGKTWSTEEKAKIDPSSTGLQSIAIDTKGRVWVAGLKSIFLREGDAWKTVDTSKAAPGALFEKLAPGLSGEVYAAVAKGLLKMTGESVELVRYGIDDYVGSVNQLAVGPEGELYALAGITGVVVVPTRAGVSPKLLPPDWSSLKAGNIKSLAVDGAGRSWIATENGMLLIDRKGAVTQWPNGSVKELAPGVEAIYVVGSGPTLPEVGPAAKGSIRGKLFKDGAAAFDRDIEVCASPSMLFEKTPCSSAAFYRSVTTDKEGTFLFEGVPLGTYGFAIKKPDGKWGITPVDCCSKMQEGKVFDIGTIELKE
jgi:hypothetical protein